jgi:hypothetical protein
MSGIVRLQRPHSPEVMSKAATFTMAVVPGHAERLSGLATGQNLIPLSQKAETIATRRKWAFGAGVVAYVAAKSASQAPEASPLRSFSTLVALGSGGYALWSLLKTISVANSVRDTLNYSAQPDGSPLLSRKRMQYLGLACHRNGPPRIDPSLAEVEPLRRVSEAGPARSTPTAPQRGVPFSS